MSAAWLLSDIAESKGRQQFFTERAPEALRALRDRARVESVESSNRIEGIVVEPGRLQPLVLGGTRPRDRSEEEITNYRRALDLIHQSSHELEVSPSLLQRLHGMVQAGSGDAGQWKSADNDIIEHTEAGPLIRFRPVSAVGTPDAVAELCQNYYRLVQKETMPPLVAIAGLVFDFLCIHPFRDGNGRISRLLTLLVLYQQGFEVGRYVSLERLVEESREDYYDVLQRSSENWHDGKHDPTPWLHFFLSLIRRAYRLLEDRAEQLQDARGDKTAQVELAVASFEREFSLAELVEACPGVSRDMVRHVLQGLRKAGRVEVTGQGRAARWRVR